MKALPWLAALVLGMITLSHCASATTPEGWTSDLKKALAQAKMENKAVLIEFTGSDWCPPCIVMRNNVFTKKEFIQKASKNFVLVELDFPNGDPALAKKNEPYALKYQVDTFPTIILLDANGQEFSRFSATDHPQIDSFLNHIEGSLEKKDLD